MKIGFDISQTAHTGGVATYTENLANQLSKITLLDMVYFYSSLRKAYKGDIANVRKFPIPPTLFEFIFYSLGIPIETFLGDIDIYHSSDWIQPPTRAKKITTYHDVIPLKYPEWSNHKVVAVHKRRLELVEKEIDMVIAVSESTRQDLIEVSQIPRDKIVVIYEAAGDWFKPQSEEIIEGFRKRMNLPKEFILAIGGVGERKNLKQIKAAKKNYHLIITTETIPVVTKGDLPLLYAAAKVLLYPSLYEGFGLPILEAMSCGLPVITSNVSSMPEVGGEAAIYVNPQDEADISRKIRLVMEDKQLREQMIRRGFQQAKKFSWEKCAQETAEVYKKLMKS